MRYTHTLLAILLLPLTSASAQSLLPPEWNPKLAAAWTPNACRDFVPNGTNAKPTFDRFSGTYYLGWQESTRTGGVSRSVFNVDVSRDGREWERKYRFKTEKSFQYPTFRQYKGAVYVTVTQGDTSQSRKERIMFGKLH